MGEFLNNRRHGRGKEYDFDLGYLILDSKYVEGHLLFEGEYLDDERHGRGKEYDKEGHLLFEGEFINGVRHGRGKEYDKEGNLIYEGLYKVNMIKFDRIYFINF